MSFKSGQRRLLNHLVGVHHLAAGVPLEQLSYAKLAVAHSVAHEDYGRDRPAHETLIPFSPKQIGGR